MASDRSMDAGADLDRGLCHHAPGIPAAGRGRAHAPEQDRPTDSDLHAGDRARFRRLLDDAMKPAVESICSPCQPFPKWNNLDVNTSSDVAVPQRFHQFVEYVANPDGHIAASHDYVCQKKKMPDERASAAAPGDGGNGECRRVASRADFLRVDHPQKIVSRHVAVSHSLDLFGHVPGRPAATIAELRHAAAGNADQAGEFTPLDPMQIEIFGKLHG